MYCRLHSAKPAPRKEMREQIPLGIQSSPIFFMEKILPISENANQVQSQHPHKQRSAFLLSTVVLTCTHCTINHDLFHNHSWLNSYNTINKTLRTKTPTLLDEAYHPSCPTEAQKHKQDDLTFLTAH